MGSTNGTDHHPGISVVIAARDAAATLPRQLDALAEQHAGRRWEVLVADNGSTDGTADLARSYAGRLPGLRVLDASAQRGAGPARNAAARAARGDVLLFCDADDVVGPGWVDRMDEALRGYEVAAGRLEWMLLNDETARRSRALPQQDGLQHSEPLPWLPHASSSNLGVRTDMFRRLGGFDAGARYLQDTDLCWRAQLAGARLTYVPDAVVHMRLRRGLRGAWRQGRSSGMGQRWLAARYGAFAARRSVTDPVRDRGPATVPELGVLEPGVLEPGVLEPGVPEFGEPECGVPVPARLVPAAAVPVLAVPVQSTGHESGTASRSAVVARLTGSWPWRVARRAALVAGEVLRVRSVGDVAALSWSTGFGVGFALGGLPEPEPFADPAAHEQGCAYATS